MSRPLRLQSSPVRVLSRNFLPDGQSDIDVYHTFFDTFCWAEGRRCALSNQRTVVSWCLIERRVRQRKVEHEHDAVLSGTGLAALPQPPRRLHHNTMVMRGITSRDIFPSSTHRCCLALCFTSAPARTLATGRSISAPAHVSVRQPQAAVASQPLTATPAAGPRCATGGWPA